MSELPNIEALSVSSPPVEDDLYGNQKESSLNATTQPPTSSDARLKVEGFANITESPFGNSSVSSGANPFAANPFTNFSFKQAANVEEAPKSAFAVVSCSDNSVPVSRANPIASSFVQQQPQQPQESSAASSPASLEDTRIQAEFSETKLQHMQEDESSPLFAMSSFEDLGLQPEILSALRMMNFKKPSRIQCAALPHIIKSDQNVIGQSQSGTGKTACFGLGILSKVEPSLRKPQGLVLAPTRELALQITNEIRGLGKYKENVNIVACIPGYDFTGGVLAQVVVGTPGRVKDAIDKRYLATENIKFLVLDEADCMLQASGGMNASLSMNIKKRVPKNCQILLFSATYPANVRQFCMAFAPNAKKFSILDPRSLNLPYIKQVIVKLGSAEEKFQFLLSIYNFCDINQSVIFLNTREGSRGLANRLRENGFSVALLQAEMAPNERDDVLNSFRKQMTRVLIATNIIARGVDVVEVSVVINYELPIATDRVSPDFETYLHRIGRCGRFGRPGVALNFVTSAREETILQGISKHYDVSMAEVTQPEQVKGLFDAAEVAAAAEQYEETTTTTTTAPAENESPESSQESKEGGSSQAQAEATLTSS